MTERLPGSVSQHRCGTERLQGSVSLLGWAGLGQGGRGSLVGGTVTGLWGATDP